MKKIRERYRIRSNKSKSKDSRKSSINEPFSVLLKKNESRQKGQINHKNRG